MKNNILFFYEHLCPQQRMAVRPMNRVINQVTSYPNRPDVINEEGYSLYVNSPTST
jgi:hypothetical protein